MTFNNLTSVILIISFSLLAQQQQWLTRFEQSGLVSTSSYIETMEYLERFSSNFEELNIISFGKSPQGRELKCAVISSEKSFNPSDVRKNGKPVVMILSGIHAGEIEGKDASFLLIRDILVTKEKSYLLDKITLLVIPIFNVDGHERTSRFNRINQDGPKEMGWRTTAQNLNLNRDWLKADTPEMQALLKLYSEWLPDFFIDCHTTDGADYQYSVTYGIEKNRNIYNETAVWNKYKFTPYLVKGVEQQGFLISPYVGFKNDLPDSGLYELPASPRFSNGYAAVQNRPSLLIETHMMKPYKERVYATKAVLNTTLQFIYDNDKELMNLNRNADKNSISQFAYSKEYLPVEFKLLERKGEFLYKGIEAVAETSLISGSMKTVYTGNKYEKHIPYFDSSYAVDSIQPPAAYVIPKEWSILADRLRLHGVNYDIIGTDKEFNVRKFRFTDVKFASYSYEGRQRVSFNYEISRERIKVPAGSYYVPVDQRTVRIIMHLLDPRSQESFVQWGFLNTIFEQKEYFEPYVMEKVAQEMIENQPELKKLFGEKLETDESFRNSSYQRLNFFYERSPYYDSKYRIYPVLLIE